MAKVCSKHLTFDLINKEQEKESIIKKMVRIQEGEESKTLFITIDFSKWNAKMHIPLLKGFVKILEVICGPTSYPAVLCESLFTFFQNKFYTIELDKMESLVKVVKENHFNGETQSQAYLSYKKRFPSLIKYLEDRLENGLELSGTVLF